jgi:hypothetical protein
MLASISNHCLNQLSIRDYKFAIPSLRKFWNTFLFVFSGFFETGCHYVAQASHECLIFPFLLPLLGLHVFANHVGLLGYFHKKKKHYISYLATLRLVLNAFFDHLIYFSKQ